MMNYKVVILFLTTLLYFSLLIFVHVKGKKSSVTSIFKAFILTTVLWSFELALFYFNTDPARDLLITNILYVVASFIPSMFFLFSFIYPTGQFTIPLLARLLIFLPNIILIYLHIFTPHMISAVEYHSYVKRIIFGPGHIIWEIQFNFTFLITFIRLFKVFRNSTGIVRNRLRHISCSSLMAVALAGTSNIFLPWFNHFELFWLGPVTIVTWFFYLVYAVYYYELEDLRIFIKKLLDYSTLATVIIIIYFLVVVILNNYFLQFFYQKSEMSYLVAGMVIVFILFPLRDFVQNVIDRYFFRDDFSELALENEYIQREVTQSHMYKKIANLAAGVAHEMKNPLTALKAYSHYLPKKIDDKDFLLKFSKVLDQEIGRLTGLVQRLTDLAKPAPLIFEKVNIHTLLDDIVHVLELNLSEKKIKLVKIYHAQSDWQLNIDSNKMKQAIENIIFNSIEAMPTGGELKIITEQTPIVFQIIIADTGYGIAPEYLSQVFDPFFSLKDQNRGMGLSIAHGIINNHKGKIVIQSKLNVGTIVEIELPLMAHL